VSGFEVALSVYANSARGEWARQQCGRFAHAELAR
jgi:hypothetical protein